MTNAPTTTLVFKDQAGEYYLLPQETLQRGRVPAEHKAKIERAIAEAEPADVSGHLAFLTGVLVGAIIGGGAAVGTLAYELSKQQEEPVIIDITQVLPR